MTRTEDGGYSAEYLYSFTCHSAPVNVVRWSPNGEILASAGDGTICCRLCDAHTSRHACFLVLVDRTIVILRPQPGMTWASVTLERDTVRSFLRGHHADVYDLSWSPDSSCLISGSVDRTAIMWDVAASKQMQILKDHTNFVQGVAWDPLDKFVATQGCDRSCRLYSRSSRKAGTAFKTVPIVRYRCVC